ncbi:hypothetical protein EVC62_16400 [Salinicola endophyticus]|uniref:LHH domain-containing protein n=1 Tax=Salinicola endophyticus TaxID=1949083 RepID=A0ABY8FJF5_9GAMM|nr:hypothetical protein EVC62_16400 [Salinicola endophyticus]
MAPIESDGKTANLHHLTQKQKGAMAEMTQIFHQKSHGVIHINSSRIPFRY